MILTLEDLGRHVLDCPRQGLASPRIRSLHGPAEITKFHTEIPVEQNVFELDIAMNDPSLVKMVRHLQALDEDFDFLFEREAWLSTVDIVKDGKQVSFGRVLEENNGLVVPELRPEHSDDVRVAHGLMEPDFVHHSEELHVLFEGNGLHRAENGRVRLVLDQLDHSAAADPQHWSFQLRGPFDSFEGKL